MRMCFSTVILSAGLVTGCDSAPSNPPAVMVGPHHGTTIRLPADKGYVELTNEPEVSGRGSKEPTAIVAYFLKTDGASAMESAPSDVRLVVAEGRKKGNETIPLSPEPKSDDLAGSSRFVSKPGPHHLATLRGTLNAKIDGQEVSLPVAGSR